MSPLQAAEVPEGLGGRRIAILVGGGIAAYKVADLASQLTAAGCQVRVGMTRSAQRFVGAATFAGLTGASVLTELWEQPGEPHVELGDWAEAILVAPATANLIARLAHGYADDLVTATVLASRCPVVVAPAMNDAMWAKGAVADNLEILRSRGIGVVEPASGRLASGHVGRGRLADAAALLAALAGALTVRLDLAGLRVVVTAGGTREPIDTVRFIGNYSSGKMGHAMAATAAARGAEVVLVTTVPHSPSPGIEVRSVETAAQMLEALGAQLGSAQVLVMAAAVADFRVEEVSPTKIRRGAGDLVLRLTPNPDLLTELAGWELPAGLYRIGFAAEDLVDEAGVRVKLQRKGLDAIVGNQVGRPDRGFGADTNAGLLLFGDGIRVDLPLTSKRLMAERIWDHVGPRLGPT